MNSKIKIRHARARDAEPVVALDEIAQRDIDRRRFIEQSIRKKNCVVAILGEIPVAYAVLEYGFYGNGFVSMLIVDNRYRRMGVGTALMRHLELVCETAKLFTSTNLSNLHMQSLLAKLDYELSGVIHNLDPGDPELVYVKERDALPNLDTTTPSQR